MRLIDADALKEHYNVPDAEGVFSYCDTIMQVIDSQPTINAQSIILGLILKDTDVNGNPFQYCSNCKCPIPDDASVTNYCGCCGSKFVKGDKDAGTD